MRGEQCVQRIENNSKRCRREKRSEQRSSRTHNITSSCDTAMGLLMILGNVPADYLVHSLLSGWLPKHASMLAAAVVWLPVRNSQYPLPTRSRRWVRVCNGGSIVLTPFLSHLASATSVEDVTEVTLPT
jgi:hypothetical protein